MERYIEKAAGLIEALPFIQQFRGETVVVKLGGSIMESEEGYRRIMQDIAFMECIGMLPVVVHGGGKAISRAMKEAKIAPNFVQGLRVTDEATIRVVEQVLNREVNPHLVDIIQQFHGKARGIHGEDIIRVEKLSGTNGHKESVDWGYVGKVNHVDVEPIKAYLKSDIIPVITPLGKGPAGRLFNINADDAATAVAVALKARKLVFLTDVPGLLLDPEDKSSIISSLHLGEVDELIERGVIAGGMLPKIKGMVGAVKSGIRKAHIIDSSMPHSLLLELFTSEGVGTEITE
ncbi:acetylglutamate kinase [Pontiella agarivorans]|uniref:Acetylglutamate kinase n=1 Tax=Pontiella agarivorans TaxID=3038953 RepID=A0ABU5MZ05_9BACT|nr:acetylglutamate kinase [Pontiella agarivorans]MDZ8119415.1 acetylglutamate kinase [Pontiella agarivorans]